MKQTAKKMLELITNRASDRLKAWLKPQGRQDLALYIIGDALFSASVAPNDIEVVKDPTQISIYQHTSTGRHRFASVYARHPEGVVWYPLLDNPTLSEGAVVPGFDEKLLRLYGRRLIDQYLSFQNYYAAEGERVSLRPSIGHGSLWYHEQYQVPEHITKGTTSANKKAPTIPPCVSGLKTNERIDVAKFNELAVKLEKQIEDLRSRQISGNVTARKAEQAAGRWERAEKLEQLRDCINGIVHQENQGVLYPLLAYVRRSVLESLLSKYPGYNPFHVHLEIWSEILEKARHKRGDQLPTWREWMREAVYRAKLRQKTTTDATGKEIFAAYKLSRIVLDTDYIEDQRKKKRYDWQIMPAIRLLQAHICDDKQLEAARSEANRLAKVSEELAQEEREKIREAKRVEIIKEKKLLSGKKGYFPTPPELAEEVSKLAVLRPGQRVLEPSAGSGELAKALLQREPGISLTVVEIDPDLCAVLRHQGLTVVCDDFLSYRQGGWDRIAMNPPFEGGRAMDHIRQAYELLAPGGRLVSIAPEVLFKQRASLKADKFRKWFERLHGVVVETPHGFKRGKVKTSVKVVLAVLTKGGERQDNPDPTSDLATLIYRQIHMRASHSLSAWLEANRDAALAVLRVLIVKAKGPAPIPAPFENVDLSGIPPRLREPFQKAVMAALGDAPTPKKPSKPQLAFGRSLCRLPNPVPPAGLNQWEFFSKYLRKRAAEYPDLLPWLSEHSSVWDRITPRVAFAYYAPEGWPPYPSKGTQYSRGDLGRIAGYVRYWQPWVDLMTYAKEADERLGIAGGGTSGFDIAHPTPTHEHKIYRALGETFEHMVSETISLVADHVFPGNPTSAWWPGFQGRLYPGIDPFERLGPPTMEALCALLVEDYDRFGGHQIEIIKTLSDPELYELDDPDEVVRRIGDLTTIAEGILRVFYNLDLTYSNQRDRFEDSVQPWWNPDRAKKGHRYRYRTIADYLRETELWEKGVGEKKRRMQKSAIEWIKKWAAALVPLLLESTTIRGVSENLPPGWSITYRNQWVTLEHKDKGAHITARGDTPEKALNALYHQLSSYAQAARWASW